MTRLFPRRLRRVLALAAGGRCQDCGDPLPPDFHADHRRPFSAGGPTLLSNGQALCPDCNLQKGSFMSPFRPWQKAAHDKAVDYLHAQGNHMFLINAAPGSGKTRASCAIAKSLLDLGAVDRVVVIAPRAEVVRQWADGFMLETGRHMSRVTASSVDALELSLDVCATWNAISGLEAGFQLMCQNSSVLVICDEHHHAAVEAAWGRTAHSAFSGARHAIILTGTPIRSDRNQTIWLGYDADGVIEHPEAGTYTLTYGDAVDLGYCRPVTFHRHEGRFSVVLGDGSRVAISGQESAELSSEHPAANALRRSLDFYRLACTPQLDAGGRPRLDGYQASMMEWAVAKLDDLRRRMPDAGGLVIAPNIETAQYFAQLIEMMEGQRPVLVHSESNPEGKIDAFRRGKMRWIVSVAMISEGVDIPRLRVLVFLPTALTELLFRQAVGRVVRSAGPADDTRAYVIMPAFSTLDDFARRIEAEMPATAAGLSRDAPVTKRCPKCKAECDRSAEHCSYCGHEFAGRPLVNVLCPTCGISNPTGRTACCNCGRTLTQEFTLTLNEAMRDGAIARGMEITEEEVALAEEVAPAVLAAAEEHGDPRISQVLRNIPSECFGILSRFFNQDRAAPPSG